MSFDTIRTTFLDVLSHEQTKGTLQGVEDWSQRRSQRLALRHHLRLLEHEVRRLQEQVKTLPILPPPAPIAWAQSIQEMPNVLFLELDTTGLNEEAEIIRITFLDLSNKVIFDQFVRPSQPINSMIARITGVTNEQVQRQGQSPGDVLNQIRTLVKGKYILSYNLDFDRGKLREAAKRVQQDEVFFLGEDVMAQAMSYFHLSSFPKLEALCQRVGSPLPSQPQQTAIDRAKGQRALVHAMAHVVVDHISPSFLDDEEEGDEHPF